MSRRTREQRLFGAACLKRSLERTSGVGASELDIYKGALVDLELSDEEVDAFLATHGDDVDKALAAHRREPDDQ